MSRYHDIFMKMEASRSQARTSPFHDQCTRIEVAKGRNSSTNPPKPTNSRTTLPLSTVPLEVSKALSSRGIPRYLHDAYYLGDRTWPRGLPISRAHFNKRTSFLPPGLQTSMPTVALNNSRPYLIEEQVADLYNILRYTLSNNGINPNEDHGIFDALRLTTDQYGNVNESIAHFTASTAAYRPEIQKQLAECEHRRVNVTALGGTPAPEGYFEEQMESEKMLYVGDKWLRWEVVCEMLEGVEKEKEMLLQKMQEARIQECLEKERLEREEAQEQARQAYEEAQRRLRYQNSEDDIEYSFRGRGRGSRVNNSSRNGLYRNAPRNSRSKAITKSTNTSRRNKHFWEDE